jgi:hypothetical protein
MMWTGKRSLAPLAPIYEWAAMRGFSSLKEHVLIHGVPVQFLPAHNLLAEEAVVEARELNYEGCRSVSPPPTTWLRWRCRLGAPGDASAPGSCWKRGCSIARGS